MEYNPNKVIKMIQMGQKDKILNSSTIWLCVSCETCITRCPNEVDIARMMDVLRQMAIETGVGAKEKNILKFHEAFLSSIKFGGRINEMMMTVHYKLKSGDLFSDMDIAPAMFLKGKLSLLPPRTKDMKSIKRFLKKRRKYNDNVVLHQAITGVMQRSNKYKRRLLFESFILSGMLPPWHGKGI